MRDGAGFFIALESSDQGRASVLSSALADQLTGMGHVVARTADLTGCTLVTRISDLVDTPAASLDAITASLLLTAARRQLIKTVIEPALDRGEVVICDGFINSALARLGAASGVSADIGLGLHSYGCDDLWPDLTILVEPTGVTSFPHAVPHPRASTDRFRTSLRKSMAYVPDSDYGIVEGNGSTDSVLARAVALIASNDRFERFVQRSSAARHWRAA